MHPPFKPDKIWGGCFILAAIASLLMIVLGIPALVNSRIRCLLKGWWFRMRNCDKGNSDSRIVL